MKDDLSDTTIILPTLNETENIRRIVWLLTGRYKKVNIIVADDGSTDGTSQAVLEMQRKNSRVRLLDRTKRKEHGLTASVLEAAMLVNTPRTVVMDADLQHPVNKVGEMVRALQKADLVIGVRRRVKNWGVTRRLISKSVAGMSYVVFRLRDKPTCNDMLSGFFAIRTDVFRGLVVNRRGEFVRRGYKILLDILRMVGKECKMAEVYYSTFHRRERGESKLDFRHVIYTLLSIYRMG